MIKYDHSNKSSGKVLLSVLLCILQSDISDAILKVSLKTRVASADLCAIQFSLVQFSSSDERLDKLPSCTEWF